MTSHPDEGTLHAYIDGELPASEAAALELHVRACARCAAALAEVRGFVAAASRAISALDAAPASGSKAGAVSAAGAISPRTVRARRAFRVPFARAAALLLLAGGTAVVVNNSGTFDTGDRASESAGPALVAADAAPAEAQGVVSGMPAVAEQRAQPENVAPTQATNPARARAARNAPAVTGTASSADAAFKSAGSGRPSTDVAGRVAGVAGGAATAERAVAAQAAPPVVALESAPPVQPRRPEGVVADAVAVPPPPPAPPPSANARAEPAQESALAATGAASPVRVTRLRTKAGVVLTLTDEPIRASFADDATAARRSVLRPAPMRTSQSSAQAAAAPVMNSYRWTSVEQGRTYTLTGPMPVAELEATARRLGELERIP